MRQVRAVNSLLRQLGSRLKQEIKTGANQTLRIGLSNFSTISIALLVVAIEVLLGFRGTHCWLKQINRKSCLESRRPFLKRRSGQPWVIVGGLPLPPSTQLCLFTRFKVLNPAFVDRGSHTLVQFFIIFREICQSCFQLGFREFSPLKSSEGVWINLQDQFKVNDAFFFRDH